MLKCNGGLGGILGPSEPTPSLVDDMMRLANEAEGLATRVGRLEEALLGSSPGVGDLALETYGAVPMLQQRATDARAAIDCAHAALERIQTRILGG